MPCPQSIEELADLALDVARRGGEMVLRHAASARSATAKDTPGKGFDPVTEADRKAEQAMRGAISAACPGHAIRGEEMADHEADSPWTWLLDPIDGTRSFLYGVPTWMSLVALLREGVPVVGVAHQPLLGITFIGTPAGAWRLASSGKERLKTRPAASLADALAGTTMPGLYRTPRERRALAAMERSCRMLRYDADAFFYAAVAEGRIDIAFDTRLAPHDIAAMIPILRGAGGIITDWDGTPAPLGGQVLAAASEELLAQALPLLAAAEADVVAGSGASAAD